MLFIFGIGPKTKVIERSQFLCPVCQTRADYELRQQRNYFSLFFIPLAVKPRPSGRGYKAAIR